jgi:hypothetical protein
MFRCILFLLVVTDASPKTADVYSTRNNGHKGPAQIKETVDRAVGPTPIPAGHAPADLKHYFGFPPYIGDPRNNNFLDPSFGKQLIPFVCKT